MCVGESGGGGGGGKERLRELLPSSRFEAGLVTGDPDRELNIVYVSEPSS